MPRGEMVLIIDRDVIQGEAHEENKAANISALVNSFEQNGMDHRAALKKAARELGLSRDEAYRRLVAERGK